MLTCGGALRAQQPYSVSHQRSHSLLFFFCSRYPRNERWEGALSGGIALQFLHTSVTSDDFSLNCYWTVTHPK